MKPTREKTGRPGRRGFLKSAAAATGGAMANQRAEGAGRRKLALGGVRIIDLSVALEDGAPGELTPPRIEYVDHGASAATVAAIFGCRPEDLVYSHGAGWAVENLSASSHTGTHIDAPYHYGASSGGKAAKRIDEVPLEWFFGPGVLIDMRHKKNGELIGVEDLEAALKRARHTLKPGEIVLIHTGASIHWGSRKYFEQPGLGRESTLWLVERGVRVIGIDAWTLDRPFGAMSAEFQKTGDGRVLWAAHYAGLTREYCQIEKLANLEQIPGPTGFYVSCLPVKIRSASAGWCRAVALVPR